MNTRLTLLLELLWWIFTALLVYLLLLPVPGAFSGFPYLVVFIVFVVAFITFTRYIFLLNISPFARNKWFKIILIFVCIPWIFYLVQALNGFFIYVDDHGYESLIRHVSDHLSYAETKKATGYISSSIVFFGIGSIIAAGLLPFRLVLSLYRQYKNTLHNRR